MHTFRDAARLVTTRQTLQGTVSFSRTAWLAAGWAVHTLRADARLVTARQLAPGTACVSTTARLAASSVVHPYRAAWLTTTLAVHALRYAPVAAVCDVHIHRTAGLAACRMVHAHRAARLSVRRRAHAGWCARVDRTVATIWVGPTHRAARVAVAMAVQRGLQDEWAAWQHAGRVVGPRGAAPAVVQELEGGHRAVRVAIAMAVQDKGAAWLSAERAVGPRRAAPAVVQDAEGGMASAGSLCGKGWALPWAGRYLAQWSALRLFHTLLLGRPDVAAELLNTAVGWCLLTQVCSG